MKVKIRENGWTLVPADVYSAKVEKIEELDLEYGPCAKFVFRITDGDYAGEMVDGLASLGKDGISPKSKLYTWILAITGQSLEEIEEFELDDLVGKPCRLNVTEKKKDDGTEYNRIEAVLPPPKKRPAGSKKTDDDF